MGKKPATKSKKKPPPKRRAKAAPKKKPKRKSPSSAAERRHASTVRHSTIKRKASAGKARRAKYEKSPKRWLKYYLSEAYWRPFEKPHEEIIAGAIEASETGGRFAVAAERGIGKSALLWGIILMLKLTGAQTFPVCVPWSATDLRAAFEFWKNALCFNTRIAADYPEYAAPFVHSKGVAQRVAAAIWADTLEPTGAKLAVRDGIIVLPDGLGVIGGATVNGNPRGLNYSPPDGRIFRPTIALIDDVQDRKTARSALQTAHTVTVIDGDVAGMGEAGRDFPMLMSGNCIHPDDVMHHYLDAEEWNSLRVSCVTNWPAGWVNEKSACRKHWSTWHTLFLAKDGEVAFYKKHKPVMIRGMSLSAPAAFEIKPEIPDPYYGAIRSYYRMGHGAFMAEKQQTPERVQTASYVLTQAMVLSRNSGYKRLTAPPGSVLVAGVDLNYVGLNWVVLAADTLTTTRKVVAHGCFPERGHLVPQQATIEQACKIFRRAIGELSRSIFAAMQIHMGGKSHRISDVVYDASYGAWQQAVAAACREARCGIRLWPLKSFPHSNYRPQRTDLRSGEGWRVAQWPQIGQVFVINADEWREKTQRGFLVEPTEAGAVSLYNDERRGEHADFAMQICARQQVEHVLTEKAEYYKWSLQPGVPDHKLDALIYGCALTGLLGIGEHRQRRKRYKETRRPKARA